MTMQSAQRAVRPEIERAHIKYYNELVELPLPPATFTVSEFDQPLRRRVIAMSRDDMIEQTGTEAVTHGRPGGTERVGERKVFRVDPRVARAFRDFQPEIELPCGHTGYRNPRDVDGYTCTADFCDVEVDRETIERAIDRP